MWEKLETRATSVRSQYIQQRSSRFLWTLISSRLLGLLGAIVVLLWRAHGRVSQEFLVGVVFTVILWAMFQTRIGRGLALLAWFVIVGLLLLDLTMVGFSWRTFEDLGVVVALGLLWFINWENVFHIFGMGNF